MSPSVQPAVGDQLSPIQALIAGVQATARPGETLAEANLVITVHVSRDLIDTKR